MTSPVLAAKLAYARRDLEKAQEAMKSESPVSRLVWMESGVEIAAMVFCLMLCVTPAVVVAAPGLAFFAYAYARDSRIQEDHAFLMKTREAEILRLKGDIQKLELEAASEDAAD
jgi:hypothetical protein